MARYAKFLTALAGTVAAGLVTFGGMSPEGAEQLTSTAVAFLTALGVYAIPNES